MLSVVTDLGYVQSHDRDGQSQPQPTETAANEHGVHAARTGTAITFYFFGGGCPCFGRGGEGVMNVNDQKLL